ncbi:MAG: hypothetical protein LQ342_003377 [Letrouitia transgressa]|nr:MAG: hypothetical protein LQ342_003377 [Letrouitia transgressa]
MSTETLYRTLAAASSTDQQQIQTGTSQLQNWERRPGFCTLLQSLFLDTSLPTEIRYLCIIQLKNAIDKYWRKTATRTIKKDEKDAIRSRCIDCGLNEPDFRLAKQNALMISKIVRYEFPHDWPEAVTSIVSHLRSASQFSTFPLRLTRALLILLEVTKELSTARIQRTRVSLQSAAPAVLQVLGRVYVDKVQTWVNFLKKGGNDEGGALESIDQSLLAIRVLRRLLIAGWECPNRHTEVQDIWNILCSHFEEMLSFVKDETSPLHMTVRRLIEKHLRQISKLHLSLARDRPAGFALLPSSMDLAFAYWNIMNLFSDTSGTQTPIAPTQAIESDGGVDDEYVSILEFLSLKGLLLLRACAKMVFNPIQTFKYQKAEDKDEKSRAKDLIKRTLLNENFVRTVMESLVIRFFVFRPKDLKEWEEEPEEWERREEGEGDVWEFSVRSCAEKLFLDLMINFKTLLTQPLLHVFAGVANLQTSDTLLKDSIYGAIGLSAPVLEQTLDFNKFLTSTLGPEVQIQGPQYNILRRRAAIMLGQWLPVKEGLNRPLVYQIFQHLLDTNDPSNDQVVRVTAGRQLKNVIDPFEFTVEPFEPYASTILDRLMALIQEVELGDTKMALLNTIDVIVTKMENNITPFADQIISLLPPLWDQAGEEYLMKQSILGILSALITSLKQSSKRYHPLVLPLIHSSVEPASLTSVYLLEDAMDLWSTILSQTPAPISTELLSLAQNLFPMFATASDSLRKALEISDLYILLSPHDMLASALAILSPLVPLLHTLKREGQGAILGIAELLIQSALLTGGVDALTQLTSHLVYSPGSTALLPIILSGLSDTHIAHQTTGPKRHQPPLDPLVETDYLTILSRLALASPALFVQAVGASVPDSDVEGTMKWLLTEWLGHVDNIGHPERKKLVCLGLTSLLSTGEGWILSRLQELMGCWMEIVAEVCEDEDGRDSLVWRDEGGGEGETAVDGRRREVAFRDPVHTMELKGFVREHLQGAIAASGGSEVFQARWVGDVDRDVLVEFGKLGIF